MILRRRTPDGRNLDIDMGGGAVGNVRGYTSRTIGAVQLPDAMLHVPKAAKPWVGTRNQKQALDPEEREARVRARKAAWQKARRAKA